MPKRAIQPALCLALVMAASAACSKNLPGILEKGTAAEPIRNRHTVLRLRTMNK